MIKGDTYKHKGLRNQLIQELEKKGISNKAVLSAMEKVPRHLFLDTVFLSHAYQDKAFPIGEGQTISQPFTVAFQSSLLSIQKGDKVLEIGTGSGYQTSVLLEMGAKVYTIERQQNLFAKTQKILPTLGYSPKFFYGDGYLGLPTYAPFDKIIVTAGAPYIPKPLLDQLKVGGLMVIPVGENEVQIMNLIEKKGDDDFEKKEFGNFSFVPLLQKKV